MDNKKLGWKPNLFDLLVLIIILGAVVVLVGLRLWQNKPVEITGTDITVRYTVELNELTLEVAQAIQPGDTLTELSLNKPVGVVESVQVRPTRVLARDLNTGEQYYSDMTDRYTAVIVLTSSAKESETNICIENALVVRVGTAVRLLGPDYYGPGYIVNMERSDGQ